MKVILNQDVYNLGEEGDVCDVARGYARNYLLPKKLAVAFNNANKAVFESRKAIIDKKKDDKRKAAMSLKEKIEDLTLTIPMSAGDSGKLFGAVTSSTVAEALAKEGVEIERKKIEVPSNHIKMVGNYSIRIKLYENETADLKLLIESERKSTKEKPEAVPAPEKKKVSAEEEKAEVQETPAEEAPAESEK